MSNTITAYFKGRVGVAEAVYQNDYGIVMEFDGIYLPAHFDCYFSKLNQEVATPGIGTDNRVAIPNSILADPGNMTIHIPMHTGSSDSEVEYVVYFKVVGRARPEDDGTPAQMTAVERAIALLSQPITNIEEIVNEALSFTGETIAELQESFDNLESDVSSDINSFKTEIRGDIADVEHDFDVLDGQFQTAVAALTVDSEVQGIRTGEDGVTYTTAGEAVRKQLSDTKKSVNSINNYLDVEIGINRFNVSEITENHYLNNGKEDPLSDWNISNYIYVGDVDDIYCSGEYNGERASCAMYLLCTYDKYKRLIQQKSTESPTYSVESNVAFIRFCYHPSLFSDVMVEEGTARSDEFIPYEVKSVTLNPSIYNDPIKIDDMADALKASFNPVWEEVSLSFPNTNKYIEYDGDVANYNNASYSSNISCENFESRKMLFTGSAWSGIPAIVFFDANNTVVKTFPSSVPSGPTDYVDESIDIPDSANYFIVNNLVNLGVFLEPTVRKISKYVTGGWGSVKWVVFGDSLTEINIRTTKHYFDYIADKTDINVYNMGVSGTGYARGAGTNNAFYQRISAVPTDADVITIFGSFNDLSAGLELGTATDTGTDTLAGCINTTIDNLLAVLPLANFGIVTPCPWSWAHPLNPTSAASLYCDMIVQICKRRSIPCLDLFHSSLLRPWESSFRELAYTRDEGNGVHPDENGHKLLAPRFKGFLDTLLI